jgi:hypothetical protein
MKSITPERFAEKINTLRQNTDRTTFTKEEIMILLKREGLPCSSSYFTTYSKYGIVTKVKRGKYVFPETPIYVGVIHTALTEVREYMLNANKNSLNRKNGEDLNEKINQAIDLLKSNGFLVFKPM